MDNGQDTSNSAIDYPHKDKIQSPNHMEQYLRNGGTKVVSIIQKSIGSQTPEGTLVAPDIVEAFNSNFSTIATFRRICQTYHISSNQLELVIALKRAKVQWVNELDERKEGNDLGLTKVIIEVKDMNVSEIITYKALQDIGFDVEKCLITNLADSISYEEEEAFLHGDGKLKPRGILDYLEDGLTTVNIPYESINYKEICNAFIRCCNSISKHHRQGAVFLISSAMYWRLVAISSHNNQPIITTINGKHKILQYPCYISYGFEDRKVAAIFGNFKNYCIVDRQGIELQRDPYSHKPHVEFYITKRTGGAVIDTTAFCYLTEESGEME